MKKITVSILINRSQQDVFNFLSNPANLSKWNSVLESAEWTSSDEPGIGSTYRALAKMPGGKKEALFEITQWDPPNRYGYKFNIRSFPIDGSFESLVSLTPEQNGTQLTFESQFEMTGVLKYAEGFFARMGEKGDGKNFDTAKRILEAG